MSRGAALPDIRKKHHRLPLAFCFVLILVLFAACAGCSQGEKLTPQQVLQRSVDSLLALKSYLYGGTSRLTVAGDKRLDSKATFTTALQLNESGGLDGHMVVKSPGYSYETFAYRGSEYTRVKGGDWYRVDRSSSDKGYGMVSAEARRIIARFADLAEDVRFAGETGSEYQVSLVMGDRYRQGAAAIAGSAAQSSAPAASNGGGAKRTLVIDKNSMRIKRVVMNDARAASSKAPAVTFLTDATYSAYDSPVDIVPPQEALDAPAVSSENAYPVQQPQ